MCSPKSPRTPRTPKSQGSAHLGQPPPPSPGSGQTLPLVLLGRPGRAPLNPALASGSTNARRHPEARLTPLGLADPPRAPEAPGQGLPLRRAPFPGFLLSASGGRWARRAGSGPTAQAPFRRTPSRSPNRPSGASVCRVLKPVGPGSAAPAPPPSRLLRPRPQAGNPRPPEARNWERGTAVTWAPTGSDCGAARRGAGARARTRTQGEAHKHSRAPEVRLAGPAAGSQTSSRTLLPISLRSVKIGNVVNVFTSTGG